MFAVIVVFAFLGSELPLAFAILGAVAGLAIGARLQHLHRDAPALLAVATAGACYVAAYALILLVALLAVVGGIGFVVYRLTPHIWQALELAYRRRLRRRRPSYFVRARQITADYEFRRAWLERLPFREERYRRGLLDSAETRYRDAIGRLEDDYDYLDPDGGRTASGTDPFEDIGGWFDPPQGDEIR
jgi:hypothetical protein